MIETLLKRKLEVIIIVVGLAFIFLSFYQYKNSELTLLKEYHLPTLIVGILLIILGILWVTIPTVIDDFTFSGLFKIKKGINGGLTTTIERVKGKYHTINILFGTMTDFEQYTKDTLVILPANDKFDDECIKDEHSALGSFIKRLFPNRLDIVQVYIRDELQKRDKGTFDIGQWVFMDLSRIQETDYNFKVAFVAVTHLNDNGVIKAYAHNISLALRGIRNVMDNKRISRLFLPLIGSGHGGLSPEVSLLYILLSVIEIIKKDDGQRLEEINVLIFKENHKLPSVSRNRVKRILSFAIENSK